MKNLFRLFHLAVFAFAAFFVVSAQTPTPTPPVQNDSGLSGKVFEVRLPVTVTQKKNLISGLQRGDFLVFVDGVQQEGTFFTSDSTNSPV